VAPPRRDDKDENMHAMTKYGACLAAALLLAACNRQQTSESMGGVAGSAPPSPAADAGATIEGQASRDMQAMLAYEHDVAILLPAAEIPARMQAAKSACEGGRFGACVVLDARQQSGDFPNASLSVRIVPAGVEPLIAMAGRDAELGSRSTHAEDLAVQVRDNGLAQQRLQGERNRLQEFQQRRDLSVADMIALSRQLAEVQAQLEAVEREGAQHKRRIDTQKLTLDFRPPTVESGRNEIGQALRDFGGTLSAGTAWTIRALAFLIPVLLVLGIVVALIRRLRRPSKRATP
jgi:hypothetical protein